MMTMRKSYGFRTFRITELALYHVLGGEDVVRQTLAELEKYRNQTE